MRSEHELTLNKTFVAGFFASLVNVPVLTVTEVVKCRLQIQGKNGFYKSSFDCLKSIIQSEGMRGLFRGMFATAMREVPSIVAQFTSYYAAKRFWIT